MTRKTILSVIILVLLVVVFEWKVLLTSQFTYLSGAEGVNQGYSWLTFWVKSIRNGIAPLWDPYTWSGHPFPAEMQTAAFYPLTAVLLLFPLDSNSLLSRRAFDDYVALGHILAALFMFALARELKLSRFTALVAGLCFSLAGVIENNMSWPDMLHSAIWLPLVALFLFRSFVEVRPRRVLMNGALSGLFWGLSILAGRLHIAIMDAILIASATFFAAYLKTRAPNQFSMRVWRSALGLLLLIYAVGVCTAAVQLAPSFEYGKLSLRYTGAHAFPSTQRIPYDAMPDRLNPNAWLGLLFPFGFEGNVGVGEIWVAYIGVLPLAFALVGLWKTWSNSWTRYFAGLALAVYLYAMGSLSLLHGALYAIVPYLYVAREATRFIYLAQFSLVVIAAFGLEYFLYHSTDEDFSRPVQRIFKAAAAMVLLLLAVAAVFKPLSSAINLWSYFSLLMILLTCGFFLFALGRPLSYWGKALMVGIVLFDISGFDWKPVSKAEMTAKHEDAWQRLVDCRAVVRFLRTQPRPYRVEIVTGGAEPNIGDTYGIPITLSQTATMLKEYEPFLSNQELLNARYILKPASTTDPGPLYQDANWKLYENQNAYPRAWLVHEIEPNESIDDIASHVKLADVDFHKLALSSVSLTTTLDPVRGDGKESATVTRYESEYIEMSVEASGAAFLIVSEMYYPGWRATVNGVPEVIQKIDGGLRGILVPSGRSKVEMRYFPLSVYVGAVISALTFLSVLAANLVVFGFRQ